MNARALSDCLAALSSGVAIVDPESREVLFENEPFRRWFANGAGEPDRDRPMPLAGRLPALDEAAMQRARSGKPSVVETEIRNGRRILKIAVDVRTGTVEDRKVLIVEARDITKQREAEHMLDSYSRMAERNARDLRREKERAEKVLLSVMPRAVYEEIKDFGTITPQRFDAASVLMLDFVGFTEMAASREPSALLAELNDIFSAFDRIVELFGCERIKTIGDGYLAVSGLPEETPEHAANVAKAALRMRRYLERRNLAHHQAWLCRIGIATGPLIGALIGMQKYVYDVFGQAVSLATRLEGICAPMEIVTCEATREALGDEFATTTRGEIELKGFGRVPVFTLDGEERPHA